jgi:TolB-like protein/predicted Ser/Thr protein kinase
VSTLGAEDWLRLKEVFEGARALPAESRPAYLATACHDNPALRLEVEELLASHERAKTFLEGPAVLPDESGGTSIVPSVPTRIGRYLITDTLGEGGMGVVYAAVDEQLERPLAVKVLRHESATDPTARERFSREARLAASVNHPHICQLYEIGEADGRLFMAMERLEGEPLAARLGRGAMPIAETVQIGLEVLDALDSLHRRGITHRDLKPSNVFLTPHGAKVLDFGVSLGQTGDRKRLPLTSPGAILGTPKYMAPEQALGTVVTASADLFAMGAILYEMLSGTAAFEAESVHAVLEKVLHGDVPTLAGPPAVAAADRVIHRALAKSSAERYASAAAMAEDLRTALVADGSESHRGARPVTRLMVLPFRLLRPDAEIDFLAFSLADAVTNSLAPLESLVVRSTLAAARFASNAPDLRTIAVEAKVDVVLSGTLLRAGEGAACQRAASRSAVRHRSVVPLGTGGARRYLSAPRHLSAADCRIAGAAAVGS